MDYETTICHVHIDQHSWPANIHLVKKNYNTSPWSLPKDSHVIIAQGHDGDVQSVVNLLQHHADHVYLIASAKRADSVIREASTLLKDESLLTRLSAPAGLDLGGNRSADIALSVLAEIQWRAHQCDTTLLPLTNLRASRLNKSISSQHSNQSCPGKRP